MQSECFSGFRNVIGEWNAMLIRISIAEPSTSIRRVLLQNLMDELGHGDPEKFHVNTFMKFAAEHCREPCTHSHHFHTLNFIQHLKKLHLTDADYRYAYMATIESLYQKFSGTVCDRLGEVAHFHEHAVLDVEHASALYALTCEDSIGYTEGVKDAIEHFTALLTDY
jgi:hypothetical protein